MSTYSSSADSYDEGRSTSGTTSYDDDRRANPMGAYITTVGALITLVSVWLPWVTVGKGDETNNAVSGYEADSIVPFVGFLGLALSLALLYAVSRADRRQHRGLSLVSMAVGLAWLLFTISFLLDPISTRQYNENVSTEYGLIVSLIGALIWTIGSFLLAKEPEGDDETGRVVSTRTTARPVGTTSSSTSTVGQTHSTTVDDTDFDDRNSRGATSTDDFGQSGTTGSSSR